LGNLQAVSLAPPNGGAFFSGRKRLLQAAFASLRADADRVRGVYGPL
jgi:hypothetical protein